MELHGRNLVGSKLAPQLGSNGHDTFRALNPATGDHMEPPFAAATTAEVDQALDKALAAFETFRSLPGAQRATLLERMAEEIVALGDQLVERCCAETGLPAARITGERARTCGQLKMFADLVREGSWVDARIDTALPDRQPLPKPDLRRMLIPIGPVVVFGASNFPLAFSVAGGDTASALAAGNPVIVKAHRSHPGTAELVGRALQTAIAALGLPEGIFSLLHGSGREVGTAMVTHPATKAVGFTGSTAGGRALFDAAAGRSEPIPVYAEMGSINPVFVLPGALKERSAQIAQGLAGSVTLGVGQFCTNPGLVLGLAGPGLDAFVRQTAKAVAATPPGTMLNPGIREAYEAGVQRIAASRGVTTAGVSGAADASRNQAESAVLATDADTFLGNPELGEEMFGPATLVVSSTSVDQLLEVARGLEGHLTATIHGTPEDLAANAELVQVLQQKVGRLIFNGFPTGVEVCPSMNHGGPYPACSDVHFTSVGTAAIHRFSRPVCLQGFPDTALPPELQSANPLGIWRLVDSQLTKDAVQ